MAYWSTPVTDREYGARMTHVDMNRITNNLNYLAEQLHEHALYYGPEVSKTDWVYNDYVYLIQWQEILKVLDRLVASTNIDYTEPGNEDTTYQNINNVEDLIRKVRERYDLLMGQGNANLYVDTEVWSGEGYPGGVQDPTTNPFRRLRHYCDTEIYCGEPANAGGAK